MAGVGRSPQRDENEISFRARKIAQPGPDRISAGLPVHLEPDHRPPMPFHAELQQLFHRRSAQIRRPTRRLARRAENLPLPPLPSRRLRYDESTSMLLV